MRPFGLLVRSFRDSGMLELRLVVLNMRLLRVLDCRTWDRDVDNFDVIGRLIHLRYLAISNLPASIGNLMKLEHLSVWASQGLVLPSVIGKMMKLRFLKFDRPAILDKDCDSFQNNVEILSGVGIFELKDEEMLKCWPNLRKLKCTCGPLRVKVEREVTYRYPDLRFLTQLESLNMRCKKRCQPVMFRIPSTIKKLTLSGFEFRGKNMSVIGALLNLEVLKLLDCIFQIGTWETNDGEFQQLRYSQLVGVRLAKLNVGSKEHFPKLQRQSLLGCTWLEEIASEIGEIGTLELIEVDRCSKEVVESARRILEEQQDIGNDQLRIIINDR